MGGLLTMMRATAEGEAEAVRAAEDVCASCGIAEVDNIKLEECGGCDLVKYCGDKCKEDHLELHGEQCKRRAKDLRNKKLFRQPDSTHDGECPICFLPMPLDLTKTTYHHCCSKTICNGCDYANGISNKQKNCPFCREPLPDGDQKEYERRRMKRVKANDPVAMRELGAERYNEGDYDGAFEYLTKAAELEDADAHYQLGWMYMEGKGVEKDEEKAVYHYEIAAIGGHPTARYNLGCYEEKGGRFERAVKHWVISAKLGCKNSMKALWGHYKQGNISKEDLEATLRVHQAAIDAMKSPQRTAAQAAFGG